MPTPGKPVKYRAILAVLPIYRASFVEATREQLAPDTVEFAAGDRHLVPSVRSAMELVDRPLKNIALLRRRALWQTGALAHVRQRPTIVVDLNPRSVSAWAILLARRITRRRTVAWGHIHPRAGAEARTAFLRRFMMRLTDGVICYTYSDQREMAAKSPHLPTWVASNGLYRRDELLGVLDASARDRRSFLYVGRIEEEKKPELMIRAFAELVRTRSPEEELRLEIVGSGEALPGCRLLAEKLAIDDRVVFHGPLNEFEDLREVYGRTVCSLSPGYAGLSITQSLGFGVPVIVARDEPHAPEIELLTDETGYWFESDSSESLARVMATGLDDAGEWVSRRASMINDIADRYSADSMASGFISALRGGSHG